MRCAASSTSPPTPRFLAPILGARARAHRLPYPPSAAASSDVDQLIAAEIGERRGAEDLEERDDVLSLLILARPRGTAPR